MKDTATTPESVTPESGGATNGNGAAEGARPVDAGNNGNPEISELRELVKSLASQSAMHNQALAALLRDEGEEAPRPAAKPYEFPDVEGAEGLAPALREHFGALRNEIEALKADNSRLRTENVSGRQKDQWEAFQEDNPDWEKYNDAMGQICDDLNLDTAKLGAKQMRRIYKIAKGAESVKRLESELEASKKSGPVPKLPSLVPSLRDRIVKSAPIRQNSANFEDEFRKSLAEVRARRA